MNLFISFYDMYTVVYGVMGYLTAINVYVHCITYIIYSYDGNYTHTHTYTANHSPTHILTRIIYVNKLQQYKYINIVSRYMASRKPHATVHRLYLIDEKKCILPLDMFKLYKLIVISRRYQIVRVCASTHTHTHIYIYIHTYDLFDDSRV